MRSVQVAQRLGDCARQSLRLIVRASPAGIRGLANGPPFPIESAGAACPTAPEVEASVTHCAGFIMPGRQKNDAGAASFFSASILRGPAMTGALIAFDVLPRLDRGGGGDARAAAVAGDTPPRMGKEGAW